ncbi:MFS transporter [Microbacterium sp. AGC85]
MPSVQSESSVTEPNVKGTSAIYTQKRPFRSYLLWYVLAALPVFALWGAMLGIVLPNHVQAIEFATWFTGADANTNLVELQTLKAQIDAGAATATAEQSRLLELYAQFEAARAQNLSIVAAVGVFVTMFVQPITGVLSDRTRSRFGRRAPWMALGAAAGALALVGLRYSTSIALIILMWALVQVLFNMVQGPLTATVADRVPERSIGTASTFSGLAGMVGAVLGSVAAGTLYGLVQLNIYIVFAVVILVFVAVFILFAPDRSSKDLEVEPINFGRFFASFLIPLRDADYRWVWIGKVVMMCGYSISTAFSFFMLQSYVKPALSAAEATALAPVIGLVGIPGTILAIAVVGKWSDKIGRRKPFVFWSSILLGLSLLIPFFSPTVPALIIQGVIAGTAFGAYMVVDQALFIDVIKDKRTAGRDLGMSALGGNLGQALGPVLAGQLVAIAGGYGIVWLVAAPIVLIAAIVILPVKRVK